MGIQNGEGMLAINGLNVVRPLPAQIHART